MKVILKKKIIIIQYILNNYNFLTFEEFLQAYLQSAYYVEEKLKDFLDVYKGYNELLFNRESLNKREKMLLGMLKLDLVRMLITMMKSIFSTEVIERDVNNQLIEADKIRKSDDFDFLINDKFDPMKVEPGYKDTQDIGSLNTKIDFPDYRDEPTKK